MQEFGKILIVIGVAALLVGVVLTMGWGHTIFGWMGRLPGDIRIERPNARFYFPIVTSLLLSLLLTAILQILVWLRGR